MNTAVTNGDEEEETRSASTIKFCATRVLETLNRERSKDISDVKDETPLRSTRKAFQLLDD